MKKLLTLIVTCLVTIAALAQNDKLQLDYIYITKSGYKETIVDYRLHTSIEKSMFYNTTSLWMDSVSRSDAGRTAYGEMAASMMSKGQGAAVPDRSANIFVCKSFSDNSMRVYDDFCDQYALYDENLDEMHWEIGDSVKVILDYECILASTNYHGRTWNVWFAIDLPIHDGPWKFYGLPGLILSAEDTTGSHKFEATGIERTDTPIPQMYRQDWYSKEDRKLFLKSKRQYTDNPMAYILQSQGILPNANIKVTDLNGNEIDPNSLEDSSLDFLETDYK